jgi:DNA-directed RNA polymerase
MNDNQVLAQIALEDEMVKVGFDSAMAKIQAAAKNGALNTVDGTTQIQTEWARSMYASLVADLDADKAVKDGRSKNPALRIIRRLTDPATAILITVRVLMSRLMLKGRSRRMTAIATEIAKHVAFQASLDLYEKRDKNSLKRDKERVDAMPMHARVAYLKRKAAQTIDWIEITPNDSAKVGAYLLGIAESAGVCSVDKLSDGANAVYMVSYSEDALNRLHSVSTHMAESKAFFWPMLTPPREYSTYTAQGPYISRAANRNFNLILRDFSSTNARRMQGMVANGKASAEPLKAINAIQSTAWTVNKDQLELLRPLITETPDLCPKLALPRDVTLTEWVEFEDRTSDEAKMFYSTFFGEREALVSARSTEMLALTALDLAVKFQDEERIYFPHAMDSRGRAYPIVSGLSPQGNDFSQSLLLFADGKPLDEVGVRHMAIEGANLFGVDKVSNADRELWTFMHTNEIRAAAKDPMAEENHVWWTKADKPFLFIAWCREWDRYMDDKDYPVRFRIQRDGSNNGVQHHAALSRDERAAGTVNLIDAEVPQDVYGNVAKALVEAIKRELNGEDKEIAQQWLDYGLTRADTKRSVMTMPYGSSQHSRTGFILDEVKLRVQKGKEVPFERAGKACAWVSTHLTRAMEGQLTGPMQNMAWMQKIASEHGGFLAWNTPDGFPVRQRYSEESAHIVVCHVGGRSVRLTMVKETQTAKVSRQRAGIAPNFIHSLDACHMREYVTRAKAVGIEQFSMIHDSYGCHPNDGDLMQRLIREAFVSLYMDNDIPAILQQLAPAVDPLPMGTFDLSKVANATYFFA